MSSLAAKPAARSGPSRFEPSDLAFALAWEVYAPGLGGWTVLVDTDDEDDEFLMVDPPLVYGEGFVVRPEGAGTVITCALGTYRAASLREAMLLICPLSPDALFAVENLVEAPVPIIELGHRSQ